MARKIERERASTAVEAIARRLEVEPELLAPHLRELDPSVVDELDGLDGDGHRVDATDPVDLTVVLGLSLPVVVTHSPDGFDVFQLEVIWDGPHTAISMRRVPGANVTLESDANPDQRMERLLVAIAQQRTAMLERATTCAWCGQITMPYSRDEPYCCMSCSERYRGIVH